MAPATSPSSRPQGGERRLLTGGLDRNVTNPVWAADGKSLLITRRG